IAALIKARAQPTEGADTCAALKLAANRLDRIALDLPEPARSQTTEWANEARAALTAEGGRGLPGVAANTGHGEADRLIDRLMSADPDFADCADAAALIQREIKGPAGYETWRDAAVAERVRRVSAESAAGGREELVPLAWSVQQEPTQGDIPY